MKGIVDLIEPLPLEQSCGVLVQVVVISYVDKMNSDLTCWTFLSTSRPIVLTRPASKCGILGHNDIIPKQTDCRYRSSLFWENFSFLFLPGRGGYKWNEEMSMKFKEFSWGEKTEWSVFVHSEGERGGSLDFNKEKGNSSKTCFLDMIRYSYEDGT